MSNVLNAFAAGDAFGTRMKDRKTENVFSQMVGKNDYQGARDYAYGRGSLQLGQGADALVAGQKQSQLAAQQAGTDAKRQKQGQLLTMSQQLLTIPEQDRGQFLMDNWQQVEPIVGSDFMTFWQATGGDVSDKSLNDDIAMLNMQLGNAPPEPQKPTVVADGSSLVGGDGSVLYENARDVKPPASGMIQGPDGNWIYSPEYLAGQERIRAAGRTDVTVNTGDETDPRPITGKPSKDFQRVWDEESGTYRDEAIPGTATARDQDLLNSKAFQALQANNEQFDAIMTNIDAADELISPFTAGVGSYMEGLRGTPARDLSARMETVKANIGFDKLNEMRQTSPTGGALGQVTERELKFLQSVRGSLDEGQSPAQLRETLGEIKASLQRLQEVREIAFKLEQQNATEGQITTSDPLTPNDLPAGFEVVGG